MRLLVIICEKSVKIIIHSIGWKIPLHSEGEDHQLGGNISLPTKILGRSEHVRGRNGPSSSTRYYIPLYLSQETYFVSCVVYMASTIDEVYLYIYINGVNLYKTFSILCFNAHIWNRSLDIVRFLSNTAEGRHTYGIVQTIQI